ncbi:hypothetical protein M427DRAFT_134548 [Gonapodya prolifera JEL478]|uniref:Secreted protein n=1 Tax=Gonapodya prolifera (strain JEL478) TaxID=1344416 RepID=A0A139AH83_GONPJ|nr:hypothetical protein M427DRAFT_134548 [Gonapodya prolifera JEL478]|eukprot:KXS16098.1 hypothetical protein M427DRAFT_134548 [Gonapodya prolifera JEL478]
MKRKQKLLRCPPHLFPHLLLLPLVLLESRQRDIAIIHQSELIPPVLVRVRPWSPRGLSDALNEQLQRGLGRGALGSGDGA